MQVRELKTAIEEIEAILAAAGATAQQRDVRKVIDLLDERADLSVDEFLDGLRAKLRPQPLDIDGLVAALNAAGLDEPAFGRAFARLEAVEARLSKAQAADIARRYGTTRLDDKSKARILASIKKHFYAMLNNEVARGVTERATPW